jgi:hypothetical protein
MSFRVSGFGFRVLGFEFRLRVCYFNPKPETISKTILNPKPGTRNSKLFLTRNPKLF